MLQKSWEGTGFTVIQNANFSKMNAGLKKHKIGVPNVASISISIWTLTPPCLSGARKGQSKI